MQTLRCVTALIATAALSACAPPELDGQNAVPTIRIAYPTPDTGPLALTEDCLLETLIVVTVDAFELATVDASLASPDRGHWHYGDGGAVSKPVDTGATFTDGVLGLFVVGTGEQIEVRLYVDLRDDRHETIEGVPEDNTTDEVQVTVTPPEGLVGGCN